jgi:O-glycosyl hydrolase
MLNSCVWSQNGFTVSQTASNGTYQIYFYVMENYLANFRNLNVQIEGNTVATDIGNQWAVGQWVKYGPFEVTITDGAITLDLVKVSWDPALMGMEIYSLQSGGGGTPANVAPSVALTSPANGVSFTAPANLSLAATASDSDGSISRVEFYNGATLIGTATSAPYSFLYNNAAPGSYALKAVAFDNSGASTASAVANVTVTSPGNPTLSVALTSPTPGANFKSGDPITVTAGVTDSTAPAAVAPKGATAARVVTGGLDLDVADVLQEIDGFGTAFIAMAGILQQYPEPLRSRIVDMLFNTNNGAGFSMVRSEMISDDHDKNDALWSWAVPGINSIQPTKGTWNWTGDDAQIWMMQQAQARGVKTFLSTVWSPVPWLKDNNSYIRGNVKLSSYQDYADYLSRYIREYQTRFGIPITHISPIHEPGFPANYQSCDWTPDQARNLLRDYLAPTFARDAVPAKVVLAEVNNWSGTMGHINPTLDDPAAAARLDVVAGHGYEATPLYDYHARAFQAGKKVWISEDCDLYSPRAVLDSDWVARNWVKMMHGYLTKARVSLWAHWYGFNGAWDGAGLTYSSAALSGSGASDYPAGRGMNFKAVKALHTMTHTTRFVRPGYRLLNTTFSPATDIYTMAFANPANGQVVIVAMNDTDADYNLTGAINGSAVASLKPYVTDTKGVRNVAPQPRITVNGSVFSYTVPARGVITLVRDEAQPAPPAAGAKTYVSDLKWSSSGAGYIGSIPVEIDKSLGGEFGGDGGTLRIRGTNYAKGLGLQGSAHITYHLAGRATNFSAIIGVDDAATSGNSVTFQVWGDGVKLYESPAINKSSGANGQRINVNVAGRQEIALVVNGDNQADWADASVDTGAVSGAPVVNITSPAGGATFTAPASFAINASATDSDGTVSRVDFLNGVTLISSDTSSPFSASLNGLAAGTYNLQAIAYDNSGIPSAPAYVSVKVNASNPPPAAATVLVEFFADGLKIGQVSNAPYTMTWNGAAGGSRVLAAKATRLSNNEVANSPSVTITVGAPANALPTATVTSPFSGATYTSPANITLTATAGDSDGSVSKVEFYNGVNLIGTATSAPYTFVWNNVSSGAYSINARATDNQGGIGNSPVVNFSVTPPANQPPTVAVTLPTNNAIFPTAPANIALSAVAADADGSVVKVEFFDGANKLGEVLSSPFSFNWLNVPAGNHSLTARATDNQGAVTTSSALSILVGAPGTPIFWRGINFGGGSVVVDGNAWVSHTVAETVGLSFSPRPNFSTTAFTPTPAVTGDVGPMLNSCAWAQNGFAINQTASNGTYQIYFWVMENYLANFRDINFKLEGNTVATQVGKGWSVGQWSKYGPYEVTVSDGVINLELEKVAWDPTIMGLAIYRVIPQNTQLPALTLTAPANGTVVTGPANLTLTASANDTNNAITRVEFYSSDTKLGEKSSPPYTFALNNVAPGSYNFFAVAYNAVGASTIATPALVNVVRPGLGGYSLLSNGTFQLALPGQAGMTNTVEVSTNLTQWTVLTNLLGGAGNQLFTDAQAGVLARRYYRVRVNGVATSNAVGFARIASPAGYSIIANPFIPATNTVAAIFRNVPNGTTVAKFRNETSDYAVNSYDASYNIWDEPDQSFGNGEAAFLFNPLTNGITVTFVGTLSSGTVSRQLPQGYSMLGATWPQDGPLVGTHGYTAGDGDIVYRFRDGRYVNSQYFGAFGAWDSEPDLKVGEGFFLFRPATGTWTRSFSVSQ